jgi:hypothetical protein
VAEWFKAAVLKSVSHGLFRCTSPQNTRFHWGFAAPTPTATATDTSPSQPVRCQFRCQFLVPESQRLLDRIGGQRHPLGATENRQQYLDPLVRLHAGVETDVAGERPVDDSHAVAGAEFRGLR